jgi:hypothetical protein
VPVIRAAVLVSSAALALPAAALAWGGSYPTGDAYGSSVQIDVSDTYPVDQALPQKWATFLGTLVHGPEISRLTLELAPEPEVATVCGPQALACYDPQSETIEASPEDELDAPPATQIVTHEYGHHVAENRSNAPFNAESYGTKRWASYMQICKKSATGEYSPGDEGANYAVNPGEAFAEAYRVLNLAKAGSDTMTYGWDLVSTDFVPNAYALSLLEQDVTSPWTGPTLTHWHGSFGRGTVRTTVLQTALDGTLVARLRAPSKSGWTLVATAGSTVLGKGTSVRLQICGTRKVTLQVKRTSGTGSFTVDVSRP